MTRNAYVLHDHRVIVFWTQKAACTSIMRMLVNQVLGLTFEEREHQPRIFVDGEGWVFPRPYLQQQGYFLDGIAASDLAMRDGYRTIALIRDPYDRLVSAFTNKYLFHKGRKLERADDLEPFALHFAHATKGTSGDTGYDGLSFDELVRAACAVIAGRGTREPVLNGHFSTQIPFAFLERGFEYDHIYTLDKLDAFVGRLSGMLDKELRIGRANVTPTSDDDGDLTGMSSLDILKQQDGVAKRQFESAALRRLVETHFTPDIHYIERARQDAGANVATVARPRTGA